MPTVNIPPKARFALYLLSALGSVVVAYLFSRGLIGDAETAAWAGVVAIINGLAAANTNISGDPVVKVKDAVVEGDVPDAQQRILGKAFTGGTFSQAEERTRERNDNGRADVVTVLAVVVLVVVLLAVLGVL